MRVVGIVISLVVILVLVTAVVRLSMDGQLALPRMRQRSRHTESTLPQEASPPA